MNIDEYKNKVIALFKSGKATEEQWQELGKAILKVSETWCDETTAIDKTIEPEYFEMETCGNCGYRNPKDNHICENCGEELR